jgi:AraC-like DNA-binding protein
MPRMTSIRAFDDGIDAWRVTHASPGPALAGLVAGYADYDERTGSFAARRELAGTRGVLIVNLGPAIEIVGADGAVLRVGTGAGFMGGVCESTSLSRSCGVQAGVHVFAPVEVLARIAGCPPGELAQRAVALDAVVGNAREWGERLGEAQGAAARFDLLDTLIAAQLARAPAADSRLMAAAAMLRRAPGAAVAGIAEAVSLDRRTLARRFGEMMGLSPRRYARLARFERFAAAMTASPDASLAELALAAGYYDQPHLNRDVRALADATPAELRRRLVPAGGGFRDD